MALVSSYSEARIRSITGGPVSGQPNEVHDSALNPVLTEAIDQFGNKYVYLLGLAGHVEGLAVTYDEAGVTAALAANAKGPTAWATGAIVAAKYGWFARKGNLLCLVAANTADNALLGRETTDGYIGDGRAAGDQIYGVMSRAATAGSAALSRVQVYSDPFVDDVYGA